MPRDFDLVILALFGIWVAISAIMLFAPSQEKFDVIARLTWAGGLTLFLFGIGLLMYAVWLKEGRDRRRNR